MVGGLLGLVWSPDLPPPPPSTCTDEPCFDFSFPLAALPWVAPVLLLVLALSLGGLSLLISVVAALRRGPARAFALSAVGVVGPIVVLVGGEVLPHLLNPCVLPDLAGGGAPGFCEVTQDGTDVPAKWHALDHALVGFLPLSLAVAWWWRGHGTPGQVGAQTRSGR